MFFIYLIINYLQTSIKLDIKEGVFVPQVLNRLN